MSNGVGFTVFQVPGAKTAKRPTATRLGGGPVLSSVGSSHSMGEPYASSQHTGSASVASNGSGSSLLNQPRGQRNSGTTFAAFQPPGGLQPISSQSSGITTSLGAPYAGTSGSMGSHSSTGSNSGLAVPMGVGIGFKAGQGDEQQPRGGAGWMRTGRVIRVKDSGDSFRFPLDTEHLPTVNALKAKLHSIAETHVNSPATWLDNPSLSPQYRNQSWKPHLEKKNCVIYRQKEAADASNLQRKAMLRAKLDTSLEELEYAINCATTEDQRAYMSHCYQESFLDSAATNDDPFQFLGIKWLAFQSSVDSVFSCRDTLVAEFSKTMEDAKGQKVLVKVQQSVNMADCNGNERNFGFSRTSGTWVWLFRSMGPSSGKVDVSMFSEDRFDGNRNTPSWFANRVVSTLFHVAIHHATAADAKFLVRGRMITDKAWVPNNERPACSVCFKSFNLLRSRHHCACLGIQSSKLPPGMLPETGSSFIVSVEKFCLKCINKARQERRSALAVKSAGIDLASEEAYEGNVPSSYASRASEVFYGQVPPARGSMSDHSADRDLNPQQNHSFASSSSSTSSLGGASGQVLSAINREKPADGAKEQSLVTLTRQEAVEIWISVCLAPRGKDLATDGGTIRTPPVALPASVRRATVAEPDEVQNITPLPTSFTKMEEQIAAQQALLRSMFIEGKKIMEQQQTYGGQVHPAQQQRYLNQMSPPESVEDKGTLALPPSSASIEYID
ncbi:Zinc finger, RING/FYVE/PHD-type [Phytophthora cactorum]|nr:Zinc finger, RING/FYVE/PHD-type [Phytophthora cactorum]